MHAIKRKERAMYRDAVLRVAHHIDIVVCRGAQHQGVVVREIRTSNRTPGYSQRLQASHCEPHTPRSHQRQANVLLHHSHTHTHTHDRCAGPGLALERVSQMIMLPSTPLVANIDPWLLCWM